MVAVSLVEKVVDVAVVPVEYLLRRPLQPVRRLIGVPVLRSRRSSARSSSLDWVISGALSRPRSWSARIASPVAGEGAASSARIAKQSSRNSPLGDFVTWMPSSPA